MLATPTYLNFCTDYWAADLKLLFWVLQLLPQWLCQQNVQVQIVLLRLSLFLNSQSIMAWCHFTSILLLI